MQLNSVSAATWLLKLFGNTHRLCQPIIDAEIPTTASRLNIGQPSYGMAGSARNDKRDLAVKINKLFEK
jgi:hypothetical protein